MAQKKYRVHEVGKDFGVKSNDILDLIKEYFGEESNNHMRVLSDEELDIIFETYTQREGFGTLPDYFATYVPKPPVVKKEKPAVVKIEAAKQPEKAAEQPQKPVQPVKNLGSDDSGRQQPPKQPQQPPRQPQQLQKQPQQSQKQKPQKQKWQTAVIQPKAAPAAGVTIAENVQTQTLGQTKMVDTRKQLNVNLAKYDERLNDIVGDKANRDYGKSKQKIKGRNKRPTPFRREDEQAKLKRLEQYEKDKKKHLANIVLPDEMSVSELAASLRMTNAEIVKKLMLLGIMASASQIIDYDTASLVAEELGAKVSKQVVVTIEDKLIDDSDDTKDDLVSRSPVVVVMGHVDHGKTSLLDAIRHTSVTSGEAGGITQHIGAYKVNLNGRDITFLDTPGHAAFTSMRARGAQVTDVVILVVAADDGIMPQTIEAINHSKAAGVPIVVAVNKMDRPEANFDKVLQALTEYELVPEQWGGDVICVPVSAVQKTGISELLENVLLVADMRDLKANPNREAKGTVIEAKLDKGRGPVATVLVQNGTLHAGDVVVAGTTVGRVRVMTDDKGAVIKDALPSTPVEIIGLSEVPSAGDLFYAVRDEKMARELVEQRKHEQKEEQNSHRGNVTLEDMFSRIQEGNMKTLNIIIKADVQGSAEAVKSSLEKLSNDEVRVSVIHSAVGSVTESDIMLASASGAIIVGFNIRPDANAKAIAEKDGVDIRLYRVIYNCIEEIEAAMKGMLAPKFKEVSLGQAEVRQTFKVTGVGTIAGCYVKTGKIVRSAKVRLVRDGIVVYEGEIDSLRRFKDDAKEVAEGYECGIGLEKFNDLKEGDIIEAFIDEEIKE